MALSPAMFVQTHLLLAFAALAIEAVAGYPSWLFARIGHPVTWIGALIAATETQLNRQHLPFATRRALGVAALAFWLAVCAAASALIAAICGGSFIGFVLLCAVAASLPAQRSLHRHVADVAEALEMDGLESGRRAVAMIVGRNVEALDEAGVARAAIESLAENFSDGVVAPTVWLAVAGLAGGVLYKAINTADSMVGHRSARYEAFGWAAAKLDDLVNLPASRLAALWLALAARFDGAKQMHAALATVKRDARRHRSPNAGWPEAAMAGALGLQLAGPRVYGSETVDDPFMGDGSRTASATDIRRALKLYRRACAIELAVVYVFALIL